MYDGGEKTVESIVPMCDNEVSLMHACLEDIPGEHRIPLSPDPAYRMVLCVCMEVRKQLKAHCHKRPLSLDLA